MSKAEQESVRSVAQSAVEEEARVLGKIVDGVLRQDVQPFEKAVREGVTGLSLTQEEFDALVSLAFNIGAAGFSGSSLLKEINKNKYRAGEAKDRKAAIDAIEKEFLKWNRSRGTELPGLTDRRKREASRFLAKARAELAELEKRKPGAR